ncbi:Uncharacterized protein BP5553_00080 [Venustampulla echinocandica]|uniref:Tat pathway signal sequence protein n=1 Tax=Venustampulla echinocandica TaxID=2656787 RepID=A0A370TX49_9HELO|nr:Uncharacterized protein BP5553_00080 [Venustampulla echinocandica]RDL40101.1 Uncharacterized protein BP5553_00080 [Venustampulla echinocandica]
MGAIDEKYDSTLSRPLLDEEEGSDAPLSRSSRASLRISSFYRPYVFGSLQILLIAIYTVIFFYIKPTSSQNQTNSAQLSGFPPAQETLKYQPQVFLKHGNLVSPYAKPPSPTTSRAWAELMHGGNMRISQSEMDMYNATSVRLADGSGYLAKMGFYHELHCLFKMKTWLYPEHFYPNASSEWREEERDHLEHCIEWVRTAAICRGDTTLTLFEWVDGELETKYPIPHMCVNGEELLGWSRERIVDIDQEGALEGPDGKPSAFGHG